MHFGLIVLFTLLLKLIEGKDYLIWLKNDLKKINNGFDGKEYVNNHILSMESLIPTFQHKYVYNHLVMFGFLVYSASLDDKYWNEFIEIADIKLSEEILLYHIAESKPFPIEFVPYVPPSLEGITVSRDSLALCTLTYDFVRNISTDNSTFHNMDVYVLDTGIQSTHKAFNNNRVTHGFDAIDSPPLLSDPNGHGTQVAGIIGGQGYGVNPFVNLIDVRIADANGYSRTDVIIAGLDYAVGHHMKKETPEAIKSIINLSLTGKQSKVLEFALYITAKTMLIVGSNGDENAFSCWKSPASSEYVLSVGGIMRDTDTVLPGSNYGDCVDMLAPGENIPAPYIGLSNQESKPLTGTSASTAIVTGIATHLIGIIESNSTIKDSLYSSYKDTNISEFLKEILTSTKHTIVEQTDTAHLNLYLSCDFSVFSTIDYIFTKELKLVPKKRSISALNRAKKTLLDIQNKQKSALFE